MADYPPETHLTITFTDGTIHTYVVTASQGEESQMVSRLRHIMDAPTLMLEVDNRLLLLPMQNIRSIEVNPSLPKLPDTAIRHLRPLS